MPDSLARLQHRNSFTTEFFGLEAGQDADRGRGTVAIAKDNARQIVGNIITQNYFVGRGNTKFTQEWLDVVEWLTPSRQALEDQATIHQNARNSQAEGTGTRFANSQPFKNWVSGRSNLLWAHGIGMSFSLQVRQAQANPWQWDVERRCSSPWP